MPSSQADGVRSRHASSQPGGPLLPPRSQLADLHRARILCGTARTLDERGYAATTVARIVETARVSRGRFYELFSGSDACIAALLDELVAYIEHHLRERRVSEMPWTERMRQGVWIVLSCLEHEPLLARACVLHSVGVPGATAERREQVIAALVAQVDAGRGHAGCEQASPMTAEGVIGAASRLVYSRLSNGGASPKLTDLFGELTGQILLPYLGSPQTHDAQRGETPELVPADRESPLGGALEMNPETADPLKGIAIRLTHRTALALQAISKQPGASNTAVASGAGIGDPGQASKLLARLERIGLITNQAVAETKWELNSWTLTPAGTKVVQLLANRVAFADRPTAHPTAPESA